MKIHSLYDGGYGSMCYLVSDDEEKAAVLIDPSVSYGRALASFSGQIPKISAILLTHGHFDHILSLDELRRAFPDTPVYIHEGDASFLGDANKNAYAFFFNEERIWRPANRLLHDGDELPLGDETVRVLHTPGHTPGSICLICGEDDLITGDTLFDGNYGRYDLWGGNYDCLVASMRELGTLPERMTIYPGHGGTAKLGASLRATGLI